MKPKGFGMFCVMGVDSVPQFADRFAGTIELRGIPIETIGKLCFIKRFRVALGLARETVEELQPLFRNPEQVGLQGAFQFLPQMPQNY